MKLRNNSNNNGCKGKRISELEEKTQLLGTEYLAYQEGEDNGKLSLNSLKDYLIELVQEYLINNGIIRDDYVQSEPAFKLLATLPELIADRACKDEFGNNINDTYLTREAVKAYVQSIYEDLFTENPPHIMDGYITVDMLSEAVLQLLNSGGAITNFPDEEDLTVKDGKLKFNDKEYDPNKYSGLGRVILRRNMVDGVNVLTQEMMSKPNTRYIILYDFDLRGETINVPDNCILHFVGGSLNNGTITSNSEDPIVVWGQMLGNIDIDIDIVLLDVPADEEDITSKTGELKFADKSYDVANFSGLGRKYLRKNIIDNKNILTQDMINSSNTIYIIQYDYDLNGAEIIIPERCILDFQGGSFSNGTIEITESSKLFGKYGIEDDIIFQGLGTCIDCDIIKLKSIYNSNLFNSISSTFTEIIIPKRVFTFNEPIYWGRRFSQRIIGQGNYSSVFYFPNSDGIILDGVNYVTVDFISIGIESDGCCIKSTENCITISECNFYNCSFLSINNHAISNFYNIYRDTNKNSMCIWYNSSFNECECTSWNENYACFDGIFNWSSSVICNKVTDSCRHPSTGRYDSNYGKPKCFLHNSQIILNGCNLTNTHMDYILIVDFDVYTRNKIAFYAKYCNFEDVGISIIKCDEIVRIDLDFQNNYVSKLGGANNANILNMFDCAALNIENLDYSNYKNIYVINRANCNANFIGNKSKLCLCFIDSNNTVNLIMPFTGLYSRNNDNIKRYQPVPSALTDVVNDIRDNVLSKVNSNLTNSYIWYSVVNYEPKTSSVILSTYPNTTIDQLLNQYGLAYNITTKKVCVKDYNNAIRTVNDDYNCANNGNSDGIPDVSSLDNYKDFGLRYSSYAGESTGHLIFNGSQGFKKIKITDIANDAGTTANRPTNVSRGFQYYDYTLNKPIWWIGTKWVDATGAEV